MKWRPVNAVEHATRRGVSWSSDLTRDLVMGDCVRLLVQSDHELFPGYKPCASVWVELLGVAPFVGRALEPSKLAADLAEFEFDLSSVTGVVRRDAPRWILELDAPVGLENTGPPRGETKPFDGTDDEACAWVRSCPLSPAGRLVMRLALRGVSTDYQPTFATNRVLAMSHYEGTLMPADDVRAWTQDYMAERQPYSYYFPSSKFGRGYYPTMEAAIEAAQATPEGQAGETFQVGKGVAPMGGWDEPVYLSAEKGHGG